MSTTVNQFCDRALDRLKAIEERLEAVKANLQRLPELEEAAVRSEFEASRTKVRTRPQGIKQARARLKSRSEQKMSEESKGTQTTPDLDTHADRAEANAVETIDHAAACIDDVEDAVLYAAIARLNADAAR